MIAILDVEDPAFIRQAAKRGVFAYLTTNESDDDQLESAIDVVLARFAEFHALEGAFGRRALTERAKGFSWSAMRSTRTSRSSCCASSPANPTASSSMSLSPSSRRAHCFPTGSRFPALSDGRRGDDGGGGRSARRIGATGLRDNTFMRLLARFDETELLERVPYGVIRSEGACPPCLERSEGVEFGAAEVEWIRHFC